MSRLMKDIVLQPANVCILVRRGHFMSRDKDGDHTTGSAVPKNPTLHVNLMAL